MSKNRKEFFESEEIRNAFLPWWFVFMTIVCFVVQKPDFNSLFDIGEKLCYSSIYVYELVAIMHLRDLFEEKKKQ